MIRINPRAKWIAVGLAPLVLGALLWPLNQRRLNMALLVAAEERKSAQIAELIFKGANVNCRTLNGDTPLHLVSLANFGDNGDTIKRLVAQGADVNARNRDGDRPLHYAIMSESATTVRALVQAGADVNARSKRFGVPLSQASMALRQQSHSGWSNEGLREIIQILKSRGAKPQPKRAVAKGD